MIGLSTLRLICGLHFSPISKSGQDLLIYSAIGDEEDWHENSNDDSARKDVNVGYKDGGDIIGVAELATDLLVFKNKVGFTT